KAREEKGDTSPEKKRVTLLNETPLRTHENQEPVCEEINPEYCQTKIVEVDPVLLRKNKVVSLFHDNKMHDQMKILRTQVLNKMEARQGRSLLVTSAHPGEGKTLTAVNLAVSVSHEVNQTVLFVDADLKTPSVHQFFGLDARRGLTDFLLRQAEIPELLLNPGIEKLVLLPAGTRVPNSAELLGSPRMDSVINEMKTRYPDRLIILDGPPLLTCADSLIISQFIDGILLVVEAEKTPIKSIEKAMELLYEKPLLGTVLNKDRE
ncbi:MAG: CpsD/CapB family tyrosine-protein kinase, partial [Deltaproteobacteria bacterium]|nr:CpsD/CapB family tyrosine-protein kinase [Deltaproteobacteria bacterium]